MAFVWTMVVLAALSVVTGIVDVFIPAVTGGEPFTVLHALVDVLGPGYLFLHILVHNAGLACLVPGVGLVALSFERDRKQRVLGARILLGTVVVSLVVALQYIIQARERFDLAFVFPLLAVEAAAVLVLAWRGYVALRRFVPTPRMGWAFIQPARELAPWAVGTHATLAAAALIEVYFMMGGI